MASVGNLNATLTLNGKQYELALNRARTGTKTAGRDMEKSFDKAAAAFGSLSKRILVGASAMAAGLGIATRASLKSAEGLDITAEKLGLATDRLAGLRLAARFTSGMLEGSLDTALQRMVRRVAEAANGTGEAQNAIKELGLDAAQLNLLSPDQQLRAIADAMLQVDDQSSRVRLAFKLFDTEGVGLVNTLALGSKGLDEFQARAERLGIALTKTDTIAARMATDSMDQLKLAVSGLSNEFAIGLAPTLSLITDDLSELITGFDSMGSEGVGAARVIAFAWSGVLDAFEEIEEVVREVRIGFNQLIVDAAKIAKFTPPAMVTEALGITDIKGQGAAATDTRDRLLADEMADKIAEAFREIDFASTTTGSTVGGDQFIKNFDALELRIKSLAETSENAAGRVAGLGLTAAGAEESTAAKIEDLGVSAAETGKAFSALIEKLGFTPDEVRSGERGGRDITNALGQIDRIREQAQSAFDRAARETFAGRTAVEPDERERRFATASEFVGRARDLTNRADALQATIPGFETPVDKSQPVPVEIPDTVAIDAPEAIPVDVTIPDLPPQFFGPNFPEAPVTPTAPGIPEINGRPFVPPEQTPLVPELLPNTINGQPLPILPDTTPFPQNIGPDGTEGGEISKLITRMDALITPLETAAKKLVA